MELLAGYFDGDNYIQHNPHIADKVSGLSAAMRAWAEKGISLKFDRVHRVLAQGNFRTCYQRRCAGRAAHCLL